MADKVPALQAAENLLRDAGESNETVAAVAVRLWQPDVSLEEIHEYWLEGPSAVQKLKAFAGVAAAGAAAAAGAFSGGVAYLHFRHDDGVWTNQRIPLAADGRLYFAQQVRGWALQKRYCVSDEPLQQEQLQRAAWQRLKQYDVEVSPNSHVYLKEKPGRIVLGLIGFLSLGWLYALQ